MEKNNEKIKESKTENKNKENDLKNKLMKEHDPLHDICFFKSSKGILVFDKDFNIYQQIGIYLHEFKDGEKAFYIKIETQPSSSMIYDIIPVSKDRAKKLLNFFWEHFAGDGGN